MLNIATEAKMKHKLKVLIIVPKFEYGGLNLVAIRLQQALDKNKFECVYYVVNSEDSSENPIESKLCDTGLKIIHKPEKIHSYLKSYFYLKKLFKQENFDIVHCHLPFYSGIVMMAAKRSGIKKRIAHSHYSSPIVLMHSKLKMILATIYRIIMRKIIGHFSTDIIGCSYNAGVFLCGKREFNQKGIILNNGIDTGKYRFDTEKRKSKRKDLGIENDIVLGHIGQMYYVKNQSFLIDIFYEFQKCYENSVLLLIGDGTDKDKLMLKVKSLGINDKVRFLGFRNDIPELLMAMDCFVFPSLHEGFPLTLIEAQASKLPCVVSDTITDKTKLNSNFSFISINQDAQFWCREIEKQLNEDRTNVDISRVVCEFDINNVVKKLEDIYLS